MLHFLFSAGSEVEEAEDAAVSLLTEGSVQKESVEEEEEEEDSQIPTPTPNVDQLMVDEIVKQILAQSDDEAHEEENRGGDCHDDESSDLDDDDIEFIPPRENDLSTTYPAEELPSEYSQVRFVVVIIRLIGVLTLRARFCVMAKYGCRSHNYWTLGNNRTFFPLMRL